MPFSVVFRLHNATIILHFTTLIGDPSAAVGRCSLGPSPNGYTFTGTGLRSICYVRVAAKTFLFLCIYLLHLLRITESDGTAQTSHRVAACPLPSGLIHIVSDVRTFL
ncbi:hypothetical protein TRVL_05304 [Trypanosoma vivax]|nr:hypothetical protein TRVL_05304 [Trypanosoma vivax]